jgi:exopolysaccharide biosynthesis polyprenyl glycosylphosphotransferase
MPVYGQSQKRGIGGQRLPWRRWPLRPRVEREQHLLSLRLALPEAPPSEQWRLRRVRIARRLRFADAAAVTLSLAILAFIWRDDVALRPTALALIPLTLLVAHVMGLYTRDAVRIGPADLEELPAVFRLSCAFAFGSWFVQDLVVDGSLTPGPVATLLGGSLFLLVSCRATARYLARRHAPAERCLLIGDAALCERVHQRLSAYRPGDLVISSFVFDGAAAEKEHLERLSHVSALEELVREKQVDRLVLAPGHSDVEQVMMLVHTAKALGLKVSVVPRILEAVGTAGYLEDVDGIPVLSVPSTSLSPAARALKRTFDVVGAGVGMIVLATVFAVIALLIKLDTPGPVFFRQTRVGRDGEPFEMIKFRTMRVGADQQKDALRPLNETEGLFKIADDPRITRAGGPLRRSSLDELPQLWNVLRGEMSLVGPRPLVADEDVQVVGWHRHRLHLTPGMTGHWQVLGSPRIPLQEMIRIDYLYVTNWSLWMDTKLLLRTVPHVIRRCGM